MMPIMRCRQKLHQEFGKEENALVRVIGNGPGKMGLELPLKNRYAVARGTGMATLPRLERYRGKHGFCVGKSGQSRSTFWEIPP